MASNFFITNVFWGEIYCGYFLKFCLPSLLWPKNLAALALHDRNILLIATTDEDWSRILATPLLDQARKHFEIQKLPLPEEGKFTNKFGRCAAGYKAIAFEVAAQGGVALHLSPDLLISDGTIAALHARREAGAAVVTLPAWRTALEPFEKVLVESAPTAQGFIRPEYPLSGRQLAAICTKAVHDFEWGRFWDGNEFRDDVGILWWRVPEDGGWLMHVPSGAPYVDYSRITDHDPSPLDVLPFDSYPAMFKPSGGTVEVASDSDEILLVSVTPAAEVLGPPKRTRWQYKVPLLCYFTRGLAFRLFLRRTLVSGRIEVGLRGLVQPYRLHVDDLSSHWLVVERLAQRVVWTFAGDFVPVESRCRRRWLQVRGLALDAMAIIVLPSVAVPHFYRMAALYGAVIWAALRGDASAFAKIKRRLGLR